MRFLRILCALAATTAMAQYDETVIVSRILVDIRVTQGNGEAIEDLTAADFEITLDGKPVPVESATFVNEERKAPAAVAEGELIPLLDEPVTGRLFVFFIQTDFTRHYTRVKGQMKFRRYAEDLVRSFAPADRAAVFSFDSHLKFRSDFTTDHDAAAKAIRDSILIDHPPAPSPVSEPALAPHLDRGAMRRASTHEQALLLIANALRSIDGPKTLVLIGWGLGHRARGGSAVVMDHVWPQAFEALTHARVTINVMDYTEADFHDLEHPLIAAAEQTGGFYAKTYHFPQAVSDRLRRTVAGYYMLELRPPPGMAAGSHTLDVSVKRRGSLKIMFPQVVILSK